MPQSVAQLIAALKPDPWRHEVGFSHEVEEVNVHLFDQSLSNDSIINVVSSWIQKYQPCLFGRIAAKSNFLSYCVLTEDDLKGSDESIQEKIQEARLKWTRAGFEGRKSGFIVLAISKQIAYAIPNNTLKELALRLCSLYLLEEVVPDEIFLDQICLEIPSHQRMTWQWNAGVNYFSAQGDKRWWQDHRIPGGMAFSINSVGHMVKSGLLARAMIELEAVLGVSEESWIPSKVDSLDKALELAMRTIALASDAVSGKATELLSLPDIESLPVSKCPVDLPKFLSGNDYCNYLGRYHTDYTIPSEYFRPDVERPAELSDHLLDFTYLFDQRIDNPDFVTMGEGRRIREGENISTIQDDQTPDGPANRLSKMAGQEVLISSNERLMKAIRYALHE